MLGLFLSFQNKWYSYSDFLRISEVELQRKMEESPSI